MNDNRLLVLREYGEIHQGEQAECHACDAELERNKDNQITLCPQHYDGLASSIEAHEENQFKETNKKIVRFGHRHMKVLNYIGTLEAPTEAGSLALDILPKIDLGASVPTVNKQTRIERTRTIFLRMLPPYLSNKRRPIAFKDVHIQQHADMPLMEIFIYMFLTEVQKLLQKGLAHAYVPQEDNLYCLRGKLDFAGQLRYNLVHAERFYVRYDEWTPDRPANRVIKCALDLVRRATRLPTNYRLMNQLLPHFDAVTTVKDWRVEYRQVQLQRHIKDYYEQPISWARIILDHLKPASWRGEKLACSFLFPMEEVFECYVTEHLKSFMNERDYDLKSQDDTYYLMTQEGGKSRRMQPDMVAWPRPENPKRPLLILDTKWKRVNEENQESQEKKHGISSSDLYQLYSYGMRYWRGDKSSERPLLPILFLLYPRHGKFTNTMTLVEGKAGTALKEKLELHCVPVDLRALGDTKKDPPLGNTEKLLKEALKKSLPRPSDR